MWNFTIKLDEKHQNLKGTDYYFNLGFNLEKFKGVNSFLPITGDWTILEKEEITYFNSPDISFSYQRMESAYQFHFGDHVTGASALEIMKEICENLVRNNHQKFALYFVEVATENSYLIY